MIPEDDLFKALKAEYKQSSVWQGSRSLIARVARRRPGSVAAMLGLGVIQSFLEGVALALLLPLVTALGVGSGSSNGLVVWVSEAFQLVGIPFTLGTVLLLLLFMSTLAATVALSQTWIHVGVYRELVAEMQVETYHTVFGSSADFILRQRSGELFTVMSQFTEQAANSFILIVRFVTNNLLLVAYLVVAMTQSWQLVLASLALVLPLMWPLLIHQRVISRLVFSFHGHWREVSARLGEHVNLSLTIKAFGAQQESEAVFAHQVRNAEKAMVRLKRQIAAARSIMDPLVLGMLCVTIYLGSGVFAIPIERLLVLAAIFMRVMPLMLRMATLNQQLPLGLAAFDGVMNLQRSCAEHTERSGGRDLASRELKIGIEFAGADVERGGKLILRDVNLVIAAGSITGLVGPSGAGKSTVAAAILGLARVSNGSLKIDGSEIDTLDLQRWRQRVGYVSQDAPLFGDSIRQNLLFAKPDADETAMWEALEAAGVGPLVRGLPEGLETEVGSQGRLISGGERQRIAVARALLRRPSQLILDEPASALDSGTTRFIVETIEKNRGSLTQLVIAHELKLVRNADIIYVLDNGRVTESGRWDELVRRRGKFYSLAVLQGVLTPEELAPDGQNPAAAGGAVWSG